MKIRTRIANQQHPNLGEVIVEFPIPKDEYEDTIQQLQDIGIGAPLLNDCWVTEMTGGPRLLRTLDLSAVNVDELDYLTKRLDSFTDDEMAQFQAVAFKKEFQDMKDLINLTFCCQQATVITDFYDLEAIGRQHFMNLSGGACSASELEELNGEETAINLIMDTPPAVTPYGVLYENGMRMEQLYRGRAFPLYNYDGSPLTLELASEQGLTYIDLPMSNRQLDRLLLRGDVMDTESSYRVIENSLPSCISSITERETETIHDLNRLCEALSVLDQRELHKLNAVVHMAQPEYASEIVHLVENLDLFEFVPDVRDAEEYGRYMIQESGHFEYDDNLDDFYDYIGYGKHRVSEEQGVFTQDGYINYCGTMSLEELMMDDPAEQGMQMGSL